MEVATECRPPSREECLGGNITAGEGMVGLWQCDCAHGGFFPHWKRATKFGNRAGWQYFGYLSRAGRDEAVVMVCKSFKRDVEA